MVTTPSPRNSLRPGRTGGQISKGQRGGVPKYLHIGRDNRLPDTTAAFEPESLMRERYLDTLAIFLTMASTNFRSLSFRLVA